MILKFDFKHNSGSYFIERSLLKELKKSFLKGVLDKEKNSVSLYVEGTEESLKEFADNLSKSVAYSIFLEKTDVSVVSSMPKKRFSISDEPKRALPFCPDCLQKAIESYDPFVECEVCGYGLKRAELRFRNFAKITSGNNQGIFISLSKAISNGGVAKIKTFNGIMAVGLPNEKNLDPKEDFEIVCSDLDAVNEMFYANKSQILALGSFEKPVLSLKPKPSFINKFSIFKDMSYIKVRLSDDLLLEILMREMKKLSQNHIFIRKENENENFNLEISFNGEVKNRESLEVMTLKNGKIILKRGERTLLPKIEKGFADKDICATSKNYIAINKNSQIIIDKKTNLKQKCNLVFTLEKGKLSYKASHGAFHSVLSEHDIYDKTIVGVYLSKNGSDSVMIHSNKFGLVEHMNFDFIFNGSIKEILNSLSDESKISKKLVQNYIDKFRHIEEKNIKIPKKGGIYTLFGVIALILDIYNGNDIKEGAETVLKYASSFNGKKGPRIDYKLKRYQNRPELDISKVIKTAMSYKLASTDNFTLCYGIIESFAEFINDMIDEINRDYNIDGICFNGSLFESEKLTDKFYIITDKNYKVFTNKEFTLDDMGLGYGIINAACRD